MAQIRVLRQRHGVDVPPFADACVSSLDEAVAFRPDAVVVAGPATMHMDAALPFARAGVALLIEKPLSASPDGVPELLEAVAVAGGVLMVGYNLRHLPSLQTFRQAVLAGRVGHVLSVRAEVGQYLPSWRPTSDYRNSVSAARRLGGGVLLELSHEVDYLRWIFGPVDWVKAHASTQSALEIDVEDCAHLVLGFEPDTEGRQVVGRVDLDFIRHDTVRGCIAIGESGTLRWNALSGTVDVFAAGASGWELLANQPVQGDDSYLAQWRHFLACIEGRERPLVTGLDAWSTLQVVEAARKSAARGDAVQLQGNLG